MKEFSFLAGSRALVRSGIRKVPRTVTVSYSARSSTGDDLPELSRMPLTNRRGDVVGKAISAIRS